MVSATRFLRTTGTVRRGRNSTAWPQRSGWHWGPPNSRLQPTAAVTIMRPPRLKRRT